MAPSALFQSTHPHGREQSQPHSYVIQSLFQSTHPHGRELECAAVALLSLCLFQSTHPHGREHLRPWLSVPERGFNPRTRTGANAAVSVTLSQYTCFNPRTRTGANVLRAGH